MKYTGESYEQLIQKSYSYAREAQSSDEWKILRALYSNNYLRSEDITPYIPKRIHQIWLGSPVPDKYKRFMDSWQKFNPTWEYKLWTDSNIDIPLKRQRAFEQVPNQGMRSDILRYEILHQLGGLYIDTDFECLRSFDDLLYLDFFTGIAYDSSCCLYNGLIACTPKHPIMAACRDNLSLPVRIMSRVKSSVIMQLTGPYFFTRQFFSYCTPLTGKVVAFPMDYFYPLPNNVRTTKDPYSYIKPCSYAIHHWDVSWTINF